MRLLVIQIIKGGPDLLIYEFNLLELPVGYDIIISDKMAHIKSDFFCNFRNPNSYKISPALENKSTK